MRAAALLAVVLLSCGGTASAPRATAAPPTFAPATLAAPAAPAAPQCGTVAQAGPATKATIEFDKGGTIVIQLRADKAPNTVANFAKNARDCKYDGLTFHRVEPNFVIQGGDPLGTGTGGGQQPTELSDLPFVRGAVGVARANDIRISNSMQFFVTTGNAPHLNNLYTNFGTVTSGMEVADKVQRGDKIKSIKIE